MQVNIKLNAGVGFIGIALVIVSELKLLTAVEYRDSCFEDKSWDNLLTMNCSLLNPEKTYGLLAVAVGSNTEMVQVLYVAPIEREKMLQVDMNMVNIELNDIYKSLQRIIIRRCICRVWQPGVSYMDPLFEKMQNLEYLEFSNSRFNDIVQLRLPVNLKTYILSGNLYKELNIEGGAKLNDLNANYNTNLTNVPHFNQTTIPPLTKLRLKGCSLHNMTIMDLAPLCVLQLLEVQFAQGNRLHDYNEQGYCICTILKRWAAETNFVINTLVCYIPRPNQNIECPTEDHLQQARQIREKCPYIKNVSTSTSAPTPTSISTPMSPTLPTSQPTLPSVTTSPSMTTSPSRKTSPSMTTSKSVLPPATQGFPLMYIFIFILFFVLFVGLIFYIVSRYYLQKSEKENTVESSDPSSTTQEDEEDEDKDEEDEDEDE